LLGIGLALRWWSLGSQSLWFDEGYSAWVATLSPAEIVHVIRHDVSPPLYYLILHGWTRLFGDSEFALRSLSATAASLSLLVFVALTRQVLQRERSRLVAIALFSLSVLSIQFAQEARSYAFATLLSLVALWGTFAWLGRESRLGLGAAIAACAASVWLHNMMWFYAAGLGAAWLLAPGVISLRRRLLSLAGLYAVVVVLYLPWAPSLLGQMAWLKGNFWATVPDGQALWHILSAAVGCKVWHVSAALHATGLAQWGHLYYCLLASGAAVGLSLGRLQGKARRYCLALLVLMLLPILAVFVHAQSGQSYFIEKVFTASAAVAPLLLAMSLEASRARLAGALLVLVLLGNAVSAWGYFRWEQKEQWREAVAHANGEKPELLVFVANEGEYLYDYYTRRAGARPLPRTGVPQSFFDLRPPRTIQKVRGPADLQLLRQRLEREAPRSVGLMLSHADWSDPQRLTLELLRGRYERERVTSFKDVAVHQFTLP
jgi:uncharacterized membrane protein